jgi:cyclic pyranopterin phosphate synthase
MILSDKFGRKFNYLRLSLTDVCNFRCQYCLPNGYCGSGESRENFLSLNEIKQLLNGLSLLGLKKVRLTGGEPTLRKDFLEIVKVVKAVQSIETIALTTNGYSFFKNALNYQNAGITNVTISLDSLTESRFQKITQTPFYAQVIQSIEKAISLQFESVKVNAVLLRGLNDTPEETQQFFDYVKDKPITIRFIEMMKTHDNKSDYDQFFSSANLIKEKLQKEGWILNQKPITAGPAQEYSHPNYEGKIGIIAPYSDIFCKDCNRIRISSKGSLYVCLFDKDSSNLRDLLQCSDQQNELIAKIVKAYTHKDISHFLHDDIIGGAKHFSSIGG